MRHSALSSRPPAANSYAVATPIETIDELTLPTSVATSAVRPRPRLDWMDCLRGLAIVLVIIVHAYSIALSDSHGGRLPWIGHFNGLVGPLRMPAMMFLSGLLVPRSLLKGTATYVDGKVRRILYPYFLWSALMITFFYIATVTIGWGYSADLWFRPFYAPLEHLWFLANLFLYFIIARVVVRLNPLIASAAFFGVSFFPIAGQWHTFWYFAGFFMLGVGAARLPALWSALTGKIWLSAALLLASLAVFFTFDTGGMGAVGEAVRIPSAIAGLVGAAGLTMRVASVRFLRPIRFIGRNSIVFYLAHWPLIIFSSRVLAQEHDFGVRKLFVASLVAALVGSFALTILATRFAVVNLLFVWPTSSAARPVAEPASSPSGKLVVNEPAVPVARAPIPPG